MVVHSIEARRLLVPLEHGEVHDPERGELLRIAQSEPLRHFQAQSAQLIKCLELLSAEDQYQIARLGARALGHGAKIIRREELVDRRLEAAALVDLDPDQTLGSHLRALDELGKLVYLLARISGAALGREADDIVGRIEYRKAVSVCQIGHIGELHAESEVGLVGAVFLHSLDPRHAAERLGELHAQHLAEHVARPALEDLQYILLLDERHLAVDLRELGLTVGPEILVAEASHDLEIAVVTGHHKQLFERLRRLRQRIELIGVHAAGHDEVARALGRRFDKIGRLYFEESLPVEERAHSLCHAVAQDHRTLQGRTSEVEIAVFHSKVVAAVRRLLDSKGRRLGTIEYNDALGRDLDLARRHLGVLRRALDDASGNLQNVFAAYLRRSLPRRFGRVLLDGDLHQTVAVAQIEECHSAQIAHLLHPSRERYRLTSIAESEFSASMCSVHKNCI